MEEYQVTQQTNAQLKVLYYLNELNQHWKRYDQLERGPTSLTEEQKRIACISYQYAELKLIELGYHYSHLKYNQATLTYSLPD